jgi:hypothetical protein
MKRKVYVIAVLVILLLPVGYDVSEPDDVSLDLRREIRLLYPLAEDVGRPGTLDGYVYITSNLVHYLASSALEGWTSAGTCPECYPPAARFDPQFGGQYVPLEARLGNMRDPTFLGGQCWLPDAVERDPLVHYVYTRLRTELEQWPGKPGFMPMTTFVCSAVEAAREKTHQYAPRCGSPGEEDCDTITVRIALVGLAATARRTIPGTFWPIVPNIVFEYEEPRRSVQEVWEQAFPRLQGPLAPFELSEWDPGQGSYTREYDGENPLDGDKAVHFLTHAFMAYEQRGRGVDPYSAWLWNDWQVRASEQIMEVTHPFSHKEGSPVDDVDDVIANRWGTAFGLGAFDDPELLIRYCTGLTRRK